MTSLVTLNTEARFDVPLSNLELYLTLHIDSKLFFPLLAIPNVQIQKYLTILFYNSRL